VLFYAFKARGWLGKELEPGKWSVLCPWNDQHTKGKTFDTSTVLFAPGAGDTLGFLFCSHAHCQARDSRDVLRLFSRAELDDAAQEAGLPPFRTDTSSGTSGEHRFSAKRGGHHTREWRTARALQRQREAEDIAQRILARREG
jgi:hypothetical protein